MDHIRFYEAQHDGREAGAPLRLDLIVRPCGVRTFSFREEWMSSQSLLPERERRELRMAKASKDETLHIVTVTFVVRGSGQAGDVFHKCSKVGEMAGVQACRISTIADATWKPNKS